MRVLFFICFFIFFSSDLVFSQKRSVKVNKDIVYVDDFPVFKFEYIFRSNTTNLYNLDNKKLAVFTSSEYFDTKAISNSNKQGRITFFDVTFMNDDMDKCEIPNVGFKKQLAKYIVDYDLVKDGELDENAVKQFVKIHGTKFTEDKNKSTTVIIINR